MNNLLIISCIFGKQFKYVHPSPDNKNRVDLRGYRSIHEVA